MSQARRTFQMTRARRAPRRWLPRGVLFALALVAFGPALRAQAGAQEQQVKAALLFNFCHFVEWPAGAFPSETAPLVIGILGHDPFGKFLDDLVKEERAFGRPIEVRRFSRIEEITHVHILYVSRSEQTRLRGIAAGLQRRPILSVGEELEPRHTQLGGVVGFFNADGRIKIRIDLDHARSAGLTISAKLLRVAEVVRRQP